MIKVDRTTLERMWGNAAKQGRESALELGHPTRDVLVVDGRKIAWAPKDAA